MHVGDGPEADPQFPIGYRGWPTAPDAVRDDVEGEVRYHYRSPDATLAGDRWSQGAILVKSHHAMSDETIVTRIDVRVRTGDGPYGGWSYLSFDPATRQKVSTDAETCHLCHAAAGTDGTFAHFPMR